MGGSLPVDMTHAIARLVLMGSPEAKRIFHHTADGPALTKGKLGRQVQMGQRQDTRVYNQLLRFLRRSMLTLEAEEIPRVEGDRAQLVDTAMGSLQAIASGHPLVPSEGEGVTQDALVGEETDLQMTFQEMEGAGEMVLRLQPGEGKELAVGYLHIQGGLIAEKEPLAAQATPIGDPCQAIASPEDGGQDR